MRLIDADRLLKEMRFSCSRNCMVCKNSTFLASDEHCGLIDEQPTVNEWIPFNPYKPPETGRYIVTVRWVYDFVTIDHFFKGGVGWKDATQDVIAYMPIPKPYEPTIQEKEKEE